MLIADTRLYSMTGYFQPENLRYEHCSIGDAGIPDHKPSETIVAAASGSWTWFKILRLVSDSQSRC